MSQIKDQAEDLLQTFFMKYFLWKGLVLYRAVIDCYTKAVLYYVLC